MMKTLLILLLGALLSSGACAAGISSNEVIEAIKTTDVSVSAFKDEVRDPDSPLPNSFRERFSFAIAEVAPKGGQVFICDQARYCDAIAEYFEMLSGLAGPYRYLSASGMVFAQLNSGLSPGTAEQIEAAISGL